MATKSCELSGCTESFKSWGRQRFCSKNHAERARTGVLFHRPTCSVCGGTMMSSAKFGICKQNPNCKRLAANAQSNSKRGRARRSRYHTSPAGILARDSHANSAKGMARKAAYDAIYRKSARGKAVKSSHVTSPRGRATRRAWFARYRRSNLNFRIACNLRARVRRAARAKGCSPVRDLGCTVDELRAHLEARFRPGMTWENWSPTGWHIDHIKPLSSFDLTNREQFLKACHYTNLQPLWAEENLVKGNRLEPRPEPVEVLGQAGAAVVLQVA